VRVCVYGVCVLIYTLCVCVCVYVCVCEYSEQHYIKNTAVIVTTLYDKKNQAVQITVIITYKHGYVRVYMLNTHTLTHTHAHTHTHRISCLDSIYLTVRFVLHNLFGRYVCVYVR